jgi:diguanylate cyclase (GGDEF)-like protein
VLRHFAALLLAERRPTDLVCRYGGEEMALILPETWPGDAVILAERIRTRAGAGALGYHADGSPITLSVGVAGTGPHRSHPSTLFAAANDALYRAKSDGRGRVRLADDPIVGTRGQGHEEGREDRLDHAADAGINTVPLPERRLP